jgi:hypothetical protein
MCFVIKATPKAGIGLIVKLRIIGKMKKIKEELKKEEKDNENEADESSADEAAGKEFGRGAHKSKKPKA